MIMLSADWLIQGCNLIHQYNLLQLLQKYNPFYPEYLQYLPNNQIYIYLLDHYPFHQYLN